MSPKGSTKSVPGFTAAEPATSTRTIEIRPADPTKMLKRIRRDSHQRIIPVRDRPVGNAGEDSAAEAIGHSLSDVFSIQEHGAVERVALDRFEAGISNNSAQLFFGSAVTCAGSLDYVLFQHHRAYIVAAEVEAYF